MATPIHVSVTLSAEQIDRLADRVADIVVARLAEREPEIDVIADVDLPAFTDEDLGVRRDGVLRQRKVAPPAMSDEAAEAIIRSAELQRAIEKSAAAGAKRKAARQLGANVTAAFAGDPDPGRSALDQRANGAHP